MTTSGHIVVEGLEELMAANKSLSLGASGRAGATIKRAWNAESRTGLRPAIQRHVKTQLHGNKLCRSYTAKAETAANGFPELVVYSRVDAVIPHEKGMAAPITPKKREYLAVPTDMAMKRLNVPKRLNWRLKPRHLKNAFWGRSKKGNLVLFQRIIQDTRVSRYLSNAKGKFYQGEIIPMFVMVKRIALPKRTDVYGVCVRYAPKIAKAALDALIKQFYGNRRMS